MTRKLNENIKLIRIIKRFGQLCIKFGKKLKFTKLIKGSFAKYNANYNHSSENNSDINGII